MKLFATRLPRATRPLRRQRRLRGFSSFLALQLFIAASVILVPAGPAAAATNIRAHTFNLAMGNNAYKKYQETQDIVAYAANAEKPWIVTLSEICQGQYEALVDIISHPFLGTTGVYKHTRTTNNCPNQSRGTAFISFGSPTGPAIIKEALNADDSGERRYQVCRKVWRFSLLFTPCAVHLSNDPDFSEMQTRYLFGEWADNHTTPWMIGGDFNRMFNGSVGLAQWYYTHWEIHLPYSTTRATYRTSSGQDRKIDYIFADRGTWGAGPDSHCLFTTASDHRYCNGYFTI